jgi:TonB-dependent receptor
MGNLRLGPVSVLTGARIEETEVWGEGGVNYISPEEAARRAAWVGAVTPAEAERRVIAQYGGRASDSGKYRVVLPGVHLKYEPLPGFLTRLSWSTGVGRPPFGNVIPNTSINDSARTVSVSNPELKPQRANNYDFSAEYYFRPQGMVTLGLFKKDISDYIYTDSSQVIGTGANNGFDGDYPGYRLTTTRNGGSAKIEGIELSYQQQLVFLPGWMKGFGVYANYTKLKTEGNYGGTAVLTNNSLPGFIPKNGNLGLGYRGYGFDLRVQAVYRGTYLYANSTDPALVRYQASRVLWNWKSRYAFTRAFSVFLDVENVFEAPLDEVYYVYKDRTAFYREFHAKINAGITGRF